jgi:hypothetical protein
MTAKVPQDHLKPAPKTVTIETSQGALTLPSLTTIPARLLRKTRSSSSPLDQLFSLLEGIFAEDSDEMKLIDALNVDELGVVNNTWMQGVTPGESSSSEN